MPNYIPKISYNHPVDGATDIIFTLPPTGDPLSEKNITSGKETRSNTGKTQYQKNFQDQSFSLSMTFLELSQITALRKFFNDVASFGTTFEYFISSDELESLTCIWPGAKKSFNPVRVIGSGSDFIYDLKIPLRVE